MADIKLYNGDCLDVMDKLIAEGVRVDAIITDPPYGTTACKWDSVIPFEPMWAHLHKLIKNNGAICLFGSEPFSSLLRMSNLKEYRYDWIWDKGSHSNPLLAKKQPLRIYETISVFYKKQPTYNPQMEQGKPYKKDYGYQKHTTETIGAAVLFDRDNITGIRYPKNIIKIGQNKNNREFYHPTQKPLSLMEYLVKTYTNEGDIVLDFTMGSGTTGVACKRLNRNFIGIELDKNYFEIAKKRIESEQGGLF
jgi:site-specific DNA-methyltransferase (adenine-specific)